LKAHEVVKKALKKMVLSKPSPGGVAFPASSIVIELPHLRRDKSRPGDIMALGRDDHMLDTAMDLVIASGLTKSCLTSSCKSSDFVLKAAENAKFGKDRNSVNPISSSYTKRFVPLALNHFGMRGPHFETVFKEFVTIVVIRPEGCPVLQGPFALNHFGALRKILRTWGSCFTWTTQREHASQLLRGMHAFYDTTAFVMSRGGTGRVKEGG